MARWIAAGFSLFILLSVMDLVRREKMTFKYAFPWLLVSVTGLICAIVDRIPFFVAQFLGFELTSNFVFFSLLSVFVLISLLMTVYLCHQNARNELIAQKLAILEFELKKLRKK
jgi:hypothetical protein